MACSFIFRILITTLGVMVKPPPTPRMLAFSTMAVPIPVDFEDEPGRKHITFVEVIVVLLRMMDTYDIQYAFQGEVMAVPFQVIHNRLGR